MDRMVAKILSKKLRTMACRDYSYDHPDSRTTLYIGLVLNLWLLCSLFNAEAGPLTI